ncbi:hypothetical protein D3C72_2388070 [compost metagenome]
MHRGAGVVISTEHAKRSRVIVGPRVLRQIRGAARCARHLAWFLVEDIVGAHRHVDALTDVVA